MIWLTVYPINDYGAQKQLDNVDEILQAKANFVIKFRRNVIQNITNNSPPSIL